MSEPVPIRCFTEKIFLQNLGEEEVADMANIEYNEEEKRVIAEEAREEGSKAEKIKIAKTLISLSYPTAEIVQITSLTESQVDMLR